MVSFSLIFVTQQTFIITIIIIMQLSRENSTKYVAMKFIGKDLICL